MRIDPRKNAKLLPFVFGAVCAAGIAQWCMFSGVGVGPDSVIYLSAAESIIAGDGIKPIAYHYSPKTTGREPLVSFPPTYPLLLSLSGLLSIDQLNGARCLHSLLFAGNVSLLAMIVYLGTGKSAPATLVAILLLESSYSVLAIHTMAWSEPPFILFSLLAVLLLMLHIGKPHDLLLVGSALSTGLAFTTRYAGITILPPMILTILLLGTKQFKGRIRDCLLLAGIGVSPLAAWLVRNILVADSAVNRSLAFHPLGIVDFKTIVNSLLIFWAPFAGSVYVKMLLMFLCGVLVISGVLLLKRKNPAREKSANLNAVAHLFAALFVTTYLLFLVGYNSLTNPAVDLGSRLLFPVYVFGIILVISVAYKLSKFGNHTLLWWGFLVLSFALIAVNAREAISFAIQRHENGTGFTSREWAGSPSVAYVRSLSENRPTYSNGIDALFVLTRKEALRIPAKFDPTGGKNNADFERDINTVRNELMQNRAVVIYLDKITWRWYLPSKDELENVYRLPVLVRLDDGVIYGIK
jgi:hypothetical protein